MMLPDSHWAFESINALASTGVVSGYDADHPFNADEQISCTEATTILLRLFWIQQRISRSKQI